MDSIAAVAEQNTVGAEQLSVSTQQQSAANQQVAAAAQQLQALALDLQRLSGGISERLSDHIDDRQLAKKPIPAYLLEHEDGTNDRMHS